MARTAEEFFGTAAPSRGGAVAPRGAGRTAAEFFAEAPQEEERPSAGMQQLEAIQPSYTGPSKPRDERSILQSSSPVDAFRYAMHLWKDKSVIAALYRAYQRGVFKKPIEELWKESKEAIPSFGAMVEHIRANPKGALGQFADALVADPELLVAPIGIGGGVARAAANAGAKIGPTAATAAAIGGRAVEGAISGAAIVAPVSAAQQLGDEGFVDPRRLGFETGLGAGAGAVFGGAFGVRGGVAAGRAARPREVPRIEPRMPEPTAPPVDVSQLPPNWQTPEALGKLAAMTRERTAKDLMGMPGEPAQRAARTVDDLMNLATTPEGVELAGNLRDPAVPLRDWIDQQMGIRSSAAAKESRKARGAELREAFKENPDVADYLAYKVEEILQKERAHLERQVGEAAGQQTPPGRLPGPVAFSTVNEILQKPGFLRTPEELVALRQYMRFTKAQEAGRVPTVPFKPGGGQAGRADPKVLLAVGAAGLGVLGLDWALENSPDGAALAAAVGKAWMGVRDLNISQDLLAATFIALPATSPKVAAATSMLARGVSRANVWRQLGVFQGKDGLWRSELSDQASALTPEVLRGATPENALAGMQVGEVRALQDIITQPSVYAALPKLRHVAVKRAPDDAKFKAAYNEDLNQIRIVGANADELRSSLLHETQHILQREYNMARGGSYTQFLTPQLQQAMEAVEAKREALFPQSQGIRWYTVGRAMIDQHKGRPLMEFQRRELEKLSQFPEDMQAEMKTIARRAVAVEQFHDRAYKQYLSLAGEVEARLVQDRRNMSMLERRQIPPWEMFDIPEDQWRLRFQVGEAGAWAVKEPGGQGGAIDPELQRILAVGGAAALAGAWLYPEDPWVTGAIWGTAGAAIAKAGHVESIGQGLDYGAGILSTRVRNISPVLHHALVDFERRSMTRAYELTQQSNPFLIRLGNMKGELRDALDRAILTNDPIEVNRLLRQVGDPEMIGQWREVRAVLDAIGKDLRALGRVRELTPDYFPRIVKDRDGLLKALDKEARTALEKKLRDAEVLALKNRGTGLSPREESAIINRFVEQDIPITRQPGYAKRRGVDVITEELRPFYADPIEGLHSYIRSAVQDIETARFFGRNLQNVTKAGQTYINVDASIGNLIREQLAAGKLTHDGAERLASLLRSRFAQGGAPTSKFVQDVKNLGYAGLLGDTVAAVTQMGDVAISVYVNGLRPTLGAIHKQLTGKAPIDMRDFGIAEHISEEFVSTRSTAKFLNSMFKVSGFTAIDRFGKNTVLNAALTKGQRWAASEKGIKELSQKYGEAFGSDFPQLVKDLKSGTVTDNVRSFLFHELSDVQPISRSEVPQMYLDMPNGRVVYMLKTFMLKQLDLIRREAYNEIKAGNVKHGMGNLTKYGLVLGISGATTDMVKDWMLGRPIDPRFVDIGLNMVKTFGWSEYQLSTLAQKGPAQALHDVVVPPYRMIDQIAKADPRALNYVPLVGKVIYYHGAGGSERAHARKAQQEKAEMNKWREDLRRERRERREAIRGY